METSQHSYVWLVAIVGVVALVSIVYLTSASQPTATIDVASSTVDSGGNLGGDAKAIDDNCRVTLRQSSNGYWSGSGSGSACCSGQGITCGGWDLQHITCQCTQVA